MYLKEKNKILFVRKDNRYYEKKFEKIKRLFRKIFMYIKIEKINKGYILLIPDYKKYNNFKNKIITNKIGKLSKRLEISYVVFAESFSNLNFLFNEKQVLNGKKIMKQSVIKIFEFIFNNSNKMSLEDIYVFVNNYCEENLNLIENLITHFKTVNIITKNLKYFKRFEEKLYSKGFLITVANNKRKSARNAKYVLNVDFKKEELEKYSINLKSIIINLTKEKSFFDLKFKGVIVNNINIKTDIDKNLYIKEFYGIINNDIFLESEFIFETGKTKKIEDLYKQFNAEITELTGVRGTIQKSEFLV